MVNFLHLNFQANLIRKNQNLYVLNVPYYLIKYLHYVYLLFVKYMLLNNNLLKNVQN